MCSEGQLAPCAPPAASNRLPVLAVLPDELFFYLSPPRGGVRGRVAKNAIQMTLRHSFPALMPTQQTGVVQIARDEVVAFCSHPKLEDFFKEHHAELERASILSTEFILAKALARSMNLQSWVWESGDSLWALTTQDQLLYFPGSEEELQARLATYKIREPLQRVHSRDIFVQLAEHQVSPTRFSLPLVGVTKEYSAISRFTSKSAMLFIMFIMMLCIGQGLRYYAALSSANAQQRAISAQYVTVLGPNLGDDPYGRLLSMLEKARRGANNGVNLLGLLACVSSGAPAGLTLDGFSLTIAGGMLSGQARSYEELDTWLRGLSASKEFSFSLDKASTVGKQVEFSLSVRSKLSGGAHDS